MEPPDEHDAIWAETVDGGLLHQLFGFYPTLHDACIRSVVYTRASDELEMVLDYEDEAEEGDASLKARISLSWTGVKSAKLAMEDNFLTSLTFKRRGRLIVTHLKTLDQTDGEVVSETIEAKLVAMQPQPEEPPPLVFRLE